MTKIVKTARKTSTTSKTAKASKVTAKAKAAAKAETVRRGKVAALAGKKLLPTAEAKDANPRRKDSHGFRSLEIIRKQPGLTYEAFVAAGGRPNDLRWDVNHGHVAAR